MANELTEQQVSTALATVTTPGRDRDLVAGGQVSGIVMKDCLLYTSPSPRDRY